MTENFIVSVERVGFSFAFLINRACILNDRGEWGAITHEMESFGATNQSDDHCHKISVLVEYVVVQSSNYFQQTYFCW